MAMQSADTTWRRPLRAALTLAVAGAIAAGLLAIVFDASRDRIAAAQRARQVARFAAVLGDTKHDNDILADQIEVRDADLLGTNDAVPVFRARLDGKPVAAVIMPYAPGGYGGSIRLVVGIAVEGRLLGVRVFSHRETPGLGDEIDERKSDWILAFSGRSLGNPPAEKWKVRKDGGDFDQFTGATVTPRAVVDAVFRTLTWFEKNRDLVFAKLPEEAANP